jgi:hypothetical protein
MLKNETALSLNINITPAVIEIETPVVENSTRACIYVYVSLSFFLFSDVAHRPHLELK